MERLAAILEKYGRWKPLQDYIDRIKGYRQTNFPLCIDNAKALLESIAKEICKQRNQSLEEKDSIGKLLKLSFRSLGFSSDNTILQIGGSIANIGQQMGNFRNKIGQVSHGRTMEELELTKQKGDSITEDFLLYSTEIVACFLIETFETENLREKKKEEIKYEDNQEFNRYLDEVYGEFSVGKDYAYTASEIFYCLDYEAYKSLLQDYELLMNETGN